MIDMEKGSYVDLVVAIDATGSSCVSINYYKQKVKDALHILAPGNHESYKSIAQLRVKVIGYRDYQDDQEPMIISPFYEIPEDTKNLFAFLDTIEADGGGRTPQESALEALVFAMRSDWTKEIRSRQIILLCAEFDPRLPDESYDYCRPKDMHKSIEEFYTWWNDGLPDEKSSFNPRKTRLIIALNHADNTMSFGPIWEEFPQNCRNCVCLPINEHEDWANVDKWLRWSIY